MSTHILSPCFPPCSAYFQGNWNPGTFVGADCADCAHMWRVGPDGDGGKMVCFDDVPRPPAPCNVVSVGVGGDPGQPPDFRFEISLHTHFPHCQIDVYDGTNFGRGKITNPPSFVNFHPINFGLSTWKSHNGAPVHLFKIDCEGCEFEAVEPFVRNTCPEQMMVEVHGAGRHAQVERFMKAVNRTHGVGTPHSTQRDPNPHHHRITCPHIDNSSLPHRYSTETDFKPGS